jgi:hypothetical protein
MRVRRNNILLEFFRERLVVQKDPWIVVLFVESVLHTLDGSDHTVDVAIPAKKYKGGVGSAPRRKTWGATIRLCTCGAV